MVLIGGMDFSADATFEFLDIYEKEAILWDPKHPLHRNRHELREAWLRVQSAFSLNCTVEDLKRKRDSLMACFRNQHRKVTEDKDYTPSWIAYERMASFLDGTYIPRAKKFQEEMIEDGETMFSDADHSLASLEYLEQDLMNQDNRDSSKRAADDDPLDTRPSKLIKTFLKGSEGSDGTKMYGKYLTNKLKKLDEATRNDVMKEIDLLIANKGQEQDKPRVPAAAQNVSDLASNAPDNIKIHNENRIISSQLSHIRKDLAKWRNSALDEAELCSRTWAMEYNRLSGEQQLHAKKAINDILYEGRLGRLSAGCLQIRLPESSPHKSTIDSHFSSSIVKIEHDIDCD